VAHPNGTKQQAHVAKIQSPALVELFDVPQSDEPSRRSKYPLTKEEEAYMVKCMGKYADDYTAMFRDIKVNNMQHTKDKLTKMGSRYILLSDEQRQLAVPEKVKALLPEMQ
jgi:hypothetical protein